MRNGRHWGLWLCAAVLACASNVGSPVAVAAMSNQEVLERAGWDTPTKHFTPVRTTRHIVTAPLRALKAIGLRRILGSPAYAVGFGAAMVGDITVTPVRKGFQHYCQAPAAPGW